MIIINLEGNNGKLNDMDVTTLAIDSFNKVRENFTLDDMGMFRGNAGFQRFNSVFKEAINEICYFLEKVSRSFGLKLELTSNIELETTLDFWRNNMLGRSGDVHPHLLEYFSYINFSIVMQYMLLH